MSLSEATHGSPLQLTRLALAPPRSARSFVTRGRLQVCVGLSLLILLFIWFDFSGIIANMARIDAGFAAVAIACFAAQFALAALRWMYILSRQNLDIGWRSGLSVYGAGTLANLFLVTSIAGISVRAVLLLRSGSALAGALAVLTAERIAAMAGLAICGAAGLPLAFPYFEDHLTAAPPTHIAGYAVAISIAVAAAGALLVIRYAVIRDFAARLWSAFSSGGAVLVLAVSSAGVVLLGFGGMAMLAGGMGLDINPLFFLSVMPVVAFVSALPISVGGWGVREGMMVAGLSIFTIPPESAIALSVSYGLAGLLVSATLGGLSALMSAAPYRNRQ